MKKLISIIFIVVIIIIIIVFVKYKEEQRVLKDIKKINNEFIIYEGRKIQINTLNTLMNKAIQYNYDNNIEQDGKGNFLENDTNSIKIYVELPIDNTTVSMERLLINKNQTGRTEKVEFAFSESLFEIKNIEYHNKTKQIKSITFVEIDN